MRQAKILVLEDEALVALHLEQRLQMLGHSVVGTAFSGTDALEQAAARRPELVLMDIRLGHGMWHRAAQQIKGTFDIPVVFVTAYSDDAVLEQANEAAPYGFVLKPFEDGALRIAVEIALHKHELDQRQSRIVKELEAAIAQVKTISGLLPICSRCHKIRDDEGYQRKGKRLEKKGEAQEKAGERLEAQGKVRAGEKLERKGERNERRGEHLEKKGIPAWKNGARSSKTRARIRTRTSSAAA